MSSLIIKSITGKGITIVGYASVYNIYDQDNDMIIKGAFNNLNETNIQLLLSHYLLIGKVQFLRDDNYGLQCSADIYNNNDVGRNAIKLVKNGDYNGLSVGINLISSYMKSYTRIITKCMLLEISVVKYPANQYAKIHNIVNTNIESHKRNCLQFRN